MSYRNPNLKKPSIKAECMAMLKEIDALQHHAGLKPVTYSQIMASACAAGGSCAKSLKPTTATASRLHALGLVGLVDIDRHEGRKADILDRDKTTVSITPAGRLAINPPTPKKPVGEKVPPPTWRGTCMQANPTAASRFAPVLRQGSMDFKACRSVGF